MMINKFKNSDDFYKVTLSSYSSKEAVDRYARKLLPVRKKPLRLEFECFLELLPRGARVLDIGSGTGKDVGYMLQRNYKAEGIDSSGEMVKLSQCNHGNYFRKLDCRNLDCLGECIYDGISCVAVLQHIKKKDALNVIKAIRTLLKKNGLFFLFTKLGSGKKWDTRLGEDYKRSTVYYLEKEICTLLEKGSFILQRLSKFSLTREEINEKWITIIAKAS